MLYSPTEMSRFPQSRGLLNMSSHDTRDNSTHPLVACEAGYAEENRLRFPRCCFSGALDFQSGTERLHELMQLWKERADASNMANTDRASILSYSHQDTY